MYGYYSTISVIFEASHKSRRICDGLSSYFIYVEFKYIKHRDPGKSKDVYGYKEIINWSTELLLLYKCQWK